MRIILWHGRSQDALKGMNSLDYWEVGLTQIIAGETKK